MKIRRAKIQDLDAIYEIGKSMPELTLSAHEEFLKPEDLKYFIKSRKSVFLVAEESNRIIGFVVGVQEAPSYASLLCAAVIPEYRGKGVYKALAAERERRLQKRNTIESVYGLVTTPEWADALENLGYRKGKTLIWVDKEFKKNFTV